MIRETEAVGLGSCPWSNFVGSVPRVLGIDMQPRHPIIIIYDLLGVSRTWAPDWKPLCWRKEHTSKVTSVGF